MLIVLTSIPIVMKVTVSNDKGSRWEQGLKVESCLCKHVLNLLSCLLGPCDYMFKISRHTMNSFLFFIFVLRKQVSNSQMAQTTVLLAVYDKQAKMLLAIYARHCQQEGNLQLLGSSMEVFMGQDLTSKASFLGSDGQSSSGHQKPSKSRRYRSEHKFSSVFLSPFKPSPV